jgi:hypothetical protein
MATPTYRGTGQPLLDQSSGFLGRLGALFGGQTPMYLGDGQPSSIVGVLGRVTPAYLPAPTPQENVPEDLANGEMQSSCPIDPAALASGHIAIVIPRPCGLPERDEPAATD